MPAGWIGLACALFAAGQTAGTAGPAGLERVRIGLAGDSTMCQYKSPPAAKGLAGWGMAFGECFNDRVEIVNLAASGRSTLSFRQQGKWKQLLDAKPDFVFIQFGHNDQKNPDLDANGGFRSQLIEYVTEARQAGARPVLVTPVARRTFGPAGKLETRLAPWADAMKAVATERKVPLIDLHNKSMELYSKLGPEGSAFMTASPKDFTHFSERGAVEIARLVAGEARKAVPELVPYMKSTPRPVTIPAGNRD